MKSFRIPSSPEAEKEISNALKEFEKNREELAPEKSPLSRFENLRFQILRQQFASGYMPGLPTAVGALHRVYRAWNKTESKH